MEKGAKLVKRELIEVAGTQQHTAERRIIRSHYLALKNLISDKRDDITSADSNKFDSIISEVEGLHQLVQKPKEQVADAEALLDIASSLLTAFSSQANEAMTPSDFVTALLRNFGMKSQIGNVHDDLNIVSWADIGFAVTCIFRMAPGCSTMIGSMKTEMKQRASVVTIGRTSVVRRKRTRPLESTRPEELAGKEEERNSDTDKNMFTMFEILRKKRSVRLESLVLNRASFAQTIENIFALSFLVKDGRVEITMNDVGHHLVSPKNAPSASAISSGQVCYHHFAFRFDYKDWKLMAESVEVGEELMPHRCSMNTAAANSQAAGQTRVGSQFHAPTPIRKVSRNRGLVVQEQPVGNCSPKREDACGNGSGSPQPRKRRLIFD